MPFPPNVTRLPEGVLLDGLRAWVQQAPRSQVVFIEALRDVTVPPHTHSEEWGCVLEGEIEMTIDGKTQTKRAGQEHHIPANVVHSFAWRRGTRAVLFFDEPSRVKLK
ncbi:MAG TPA: cupin domain-containing protein [Candidatus Thermoplasmatota archaeon]|nr:cupin domain-containing protein [Candidatus Thermoplasmatota archaeon]